MAEGQIVWSRSLRQELLLVCRATDTMGAHSARRSHDQPNCLKWASPLHAWKKEKKQLNHHAKTSIHAVNLKMCQTCSPGFLRKQMLPFSFSSVPAVKIALLDSSPQLRMVSLESSVS